MISLRLNAVASIAVLTVVTLSAAPLPQLPLLFNSSLFVTSTAPSYQIRRVGAEMALATFSTLASSKMCSINASNGAAIACREIGAPPDDKLWAQSVTAVDGKSGLVAHYDTAGHHCVTDGSTLKTKWCTGFVSACFVPRNATTPSPFYYRGCTLDITGKSLLVVDNGMVLAFDATSGAEQWKARIPYLSKFNADVPTARAGIAVTEQQAIVSFLGVYGYNLKTGAADFTFGLQSTFVIPPTLSVTEQGSVALTTDPANVLLLSSEGKVLCEFNFESIQFMNMAPWTLGVNPKTSDLVVINSIYDPGNSQEYYIYTVDTNNCTAHPVRRFSTDTISSFHLNSATQIITYSEAVYFSSDGQSGLEQRSLATGLSVSRTPNENHCILGGAPWVSQDGQRVLIPNCLQDGNAVHVQILAYSTKANGV